MKLLEMLKDSGVGILTFKYQKVKKIDNLLHIIRKYIPFV